MKRTVTQGLKLFSTASHGSSFESKSLQYIEKLRKDGQYTRALECISELEKKNPAFALKTAPFIKGRIIEEQLRASGELDRIFTSPLFK